MMRRHDERDWGASAAIRETMMVVEKDPRPDWVRHLEHKHGKPIDQIEGTL